MALVKMSTLTFIVCLCALAGLCHGDKKEDCSMNEKDVFSKVMSCVIKNHPEYIMTVFVTMKNPASIKNAGFMCSNEKLMTSVVECMLQFVEGCMPKQVLSLVTEVMPTHQTIQKGIQFLCNHRQEFDDPCVKNHLLAVDKCIVSKMKTFTDVVHSSSSNMREALCLVLQKEKECLDSSLAECPSQVVSNIKSTLTAFFPLDKCMQPQRLPYSHSLRFKSEGRQH
ncbi:uncharacterized protein LOC143281006 [Babylonia areolata]|uniref:uncharacterized protein LOC143281006 n=1 Tax=Babylonia areolata TaxID=304850 RepID=UPI003FD045AF